MIKGISITNFKGIGDPGIKLDLEPVTLLFGNNSAGKSTIFHAFLYAYEVLVNRNYNADRTTLSGAGVDLGGFLSFVHDHEPSHQIEIKIDLDLSSAQLDKEWRISEYLVAGGKQDHVDLSAIGTDAWSATVGIKVAWDKSQKRPFVSSFSVAIDEVWLLATWCEKVGAEVSSNTNYRHPVFHWPSASGPSEQPSAGVLDSLYPAFQTVTDRLFWSAGMEIDEELLDEKPTFALGNPPSPKTPEDFADIRMIEDHHEFASVRWFYRYDTDAQKAVLQRALFYAGRDWSEEAANEEWDKIKNLNDTDAFLPTRVLEQDDALPTLDRPVLLNIGEVEHPEDRDLIRDVVSRLALGPVRLLANELKAFRHIGPLREVPPRAFQKTLSPDPARWCSGLAAWDVLNSSSDDFVERVSDWLALPHRLDTGYSLIRKRFKEIDSDGYILRILESENPLDDLPIALEGLSDLPEQSRLLLRDEDSLVEVDPPDIAVGITQLVPVIVSALDKHDGVTLIEQPELHNHPAVEVGLGDLFIETINQEHCRFILETHGEHLILRMLRRIRETTEKELPEGIKGLSPEKVAVYYIERATDGVTAKRLRIDETGEFIDKWPKGFFRERAEELF